MLYMKKLAVLVLAAGILASSCASLQYVQKDRDVLKIAGLVNSKKSETLTDVSVTPFLFDNEIIMLTGDVASLWNNMIDAGLQMKDPEVVRISDVLPETSRLFGDSMEVQAYFNKYLPDTAKLARLSAGSMQFLFLVNGKEKGYPKIHGVRIYRP